jgi:hypothetical protein
MLDALVPTTIDAMVNDGIVTFAPSGPKGAAVPAEKAHPFRGNGAVVPGVMAHPFGGVALRDRWG